MRPSKKPWEQDLIVALYQDEMTVQNFIHVRSVHYPTSTMTLQVAYLPPGAHLDLVTLCGTQDHTIY